jgi:uncharacterized protein (UPF0264 family)
MTLRGSKQARGLVAGGGARSMAAATTGVLASVRSVEEAGIAFDAGVDIIDLKDPAHGALGAVAPEVIRAVVARVGGMRCVSATAGDLPMEPALVEREVQRIGALGVDVVKVGLYDGGDADGVLAALARLTARGLRIVVVCFADRLPAALRPLERLNSGTACGVMLDTADKRRGTLRDHVDDAQLAAFVRRARAAGLVCGLAGSLRVEDIPALVALAPDYLGFRGGLCASGRTGVLDPQRVRAVCRAVQAAPAASAATATAGAQRAPHSRAPDEPSIRLAKST